MYFPLLRAKQNELLALRESVGNTVSTEYILPILEAVNDGHRDILRCAEELNNVDAGFIFVVNPTVGFYADRTPRRINALIDALSDLNPNMQLAYWISNDTSIDDIKDFFTDYASYGLSLIHDCNADFFDEIINEIGSVDDFRFNVFIKDNVTRRYVRHFSDFDNVIIEDCFNRRNRNADYDDDDDEFFSDNIFNYHEDGYFGFGDFTITGGYYSASGGPAITAAIHLTYEFDTPEIKIRHFLSEPRNSPEDGPTLVSEALPKLVEFIEENGELFDFSSACQEFIELHRSGDRTSLGYVKKLSIKHHLELNNHILDKMAI